MKRLFHSLLYILLTLLVTACATLFNGTKQKVNFQSNPSGAEVYINGQSSGKTTPCSIYVKRKIAKGQFNQRNQYNYEFRKDGFIPYAYTDAAEVSGKVWLNLFLYAAVLPGFGVDFISGGAYKYNNDINAQMQRESNYVVIRDTIVKQQVVYVPADAKAAYQFERKSDVDVDIPEVAKENDYKFALIIGNEDYSSKQVDLTAEANVEFARNDASAFRDYTEKILGVPSQNITFLLDATSGQMLQALSKMNLIIKNSKGKAEVFVYYAGHGLPDEVSREPYIIPVDISGKRVQDGIKLSDFYTKLTEYPSKHVVIFMDACFSGGGRNSGLIAARGVKVRPTEEPISGNIIALSATSGDQSALPYSAKQHGFFTYYLLKKLKETKGDITIKELSDYLNDVIPLQSVVINDKEQTPTLKICNNSSNELLNWTLAK